MGADAVRALDDCARINNKRAAENLRAKLRPSMTGWIAHRRPFAFEPARLTRAKIHFAI